jgi:hypothetical protein
MGLRENKKTLGVNKVYRETSRSIYPFHKPVTTNISRPWLLDAIDYIKRAGTPIKHEGGLSIMHTNDVPKWGGGKTNSERINDSILAIKQRDDAMCSAFELWCSLLFPDPICR